ncbi:hypothetical protein EJ06DRAFT_573477 [Trichodelitschia bisporula]|uniref:Mmc1 C-terminal domain-containing protein n=1 Tax=Trichodelitschia bisporula TaxID=703511 RepID=A0A6G1I4K1_9PEZI|nr:hypothetical protein EJ06DRAFT_573477 [Trichodelitschia bisporula]
MPLRVNQALYIAPRAPACSACRAQRAIARRRPATSPADCTMKLTAGFSRSIRTVTTSASSTARLATRDTPLRSALSRRTPTVAPRHPTSRTYTTPTPTSTIGHPSTSIPAHLEPLYTALEHLSQAAASYTPLPALGLALRALETATPTTRIALLGFGPGGREAAAQVARLLTADPLSEEGDWEDWVEDAGRGGRAVVIRYGKPDRPETPNPILRTMTVPSRALQKGRIELLLAELPLAARPVEDPAEAILTPTLMSPRGGRETVVFPVHKAALVGRGPGGLVTYGRYTAAAGTSLPADRVKVLVDLPAASPSEGEATAIDIMQAAKGLDAIRASVARAPDFERAWAASHIASVAEWLEAGTEPLEGGLAPAHRALVISVLTSTAASIALDATRAAASTTAHSIPQSKRTHLLAELETWAEKAHSEVRDLEGVFRGRLWGRVKWWKLFWRADDVGDTAGALVGNAFLADAERGAVFLAGRVREAGLVRGGEWEVEGPRMPKAPEGKTVPVPRIADLVRVDYEGIVEGVGGVRIGPWPAHIALAREALLRTSVPVLQAMAQRMLLQCLTTIGGAAGLSAAGYVAGFTGFEVGAVGALGVVIALRRLQRGWEGVRAGWEGEVREEGRRAVRGVEGVVRGVVMRPDPRLVEGVEERRVAREALRGVEDALGQFRED